MTNLLKETGLGLAVLGIVFYAIDLAAHSSKPYCVLAAVPLLAVSWLIGGVIMEVIRRVRHE